MVKVEYPNRDGYYWALGVYAVFVLAIAIWARFKNSSATDSSNNENVSRRAFNEHYLASKSLGWIPLSLSFFASALSGIQPTMAEGTLFGFIACRNFIVLNWVFLSCAIWGPRMRRVFTARGHTTPNQHVADVFDNKILTMIYACTLTAASLIYLAGIFNNIYKGFDGISHGQMTVNDTNFTSPNWINARWVWAFALLLWICELLGGFRAVVWSDAFQAGMMILAMITVPCLSQHFWGGMGGVQGPDCQNLQVICNPEAVPAARALAAVFPTTGCGYLTGVLGLENTTHLDYKYCATESMQIVDCTGCVDWNSGGYMYLNPTKWEPSRYFEPLWGATKGIDKFSTFSASVMEMVSFSFLFSGYILLPSLTVRILVARTDETLKRSFIMNTPDVYIAFLTAMISGIQLSATYNVSQLGGACSSSSSFACFIDYCYEQSEGFAFVGIMCAISTLAALMATADSIIVQMGNVLTKDCFLDVFYDRYDLDEGETVPEGEDRGAWYWDTEKKANVCVILGRIISALALICGVWWGCANSSVNDPVWVTTVAFYWAVTLLVLCLPINHCALFAPDISAWVLIVSFWGGFIVLISMWATIVDQEFYQTAFSQEGDNWTTPARVWPGIWAVATESILIFILSFVPKESYEPLLDWECLKYDPRIFKNRKSIKDLGKEHGELGCKAVLMDIMRDTQEPVLTIGGVACMVSTIVLMFFCFPWYGEDYDGCNYYSYYGYYMEKWAEFFPSGSALTGSVAWDDTLTWGLVYSGSSGLVDVSPGYIAQAVGITNETAWGKCTVPSGSDFISGWPWWAMIMVIGFTVQTLMIVSAFAFFWKNHEENGGGEPFFTKVSMFGGYPTEGVDHKSLTEGVDHKSLRRRTMVGVSSPVTVDQERTQGQTCSAPVYDMSLPTETPPPSDRTPPTPSDISKNELYKTDRLETLEIEIETNPTQNTLAPGVMGSAINPDVDI